MFIMCKVYLYLYLSIYLSIISGSHSSHYNGKVLQQPHNDNTCPYFKVPEGEHLLWYLCSLRDLAHLLFMRYLPHNIIYPL